MHRHCDSELALVIRERRYQNGILGLERLAESLCRAIVKASTAGSSDLKVFISEAIRANENSAGSQKTDSSINSSTSSQETRPKKQLEAVFVESLMEIRVCQRRW